MPDLGCKLWEGCDAPLCPLAELSMELGVWYPDEAICRKRKGPDWVKVQKRIVKAGAAEDKYFTVEMLQTIKQVRKGIKGIDPDRRLSSNINSLGIKWLIRDRAKKFRGVRRVKLHL